MREWRQCLKVWFSKGARAWPRTLLVCALIAFVVPLCDPFDLENSSRGYSQDLFNRVLGLNFPSSRVLPSINPRYDPGKHGDVTVVLIDEQSLRRLKLRDRDRTWPAPPSFHAMALEAILVYRPRAVFVDLLFVDAVDDASFGPVKRAIAHYGNAGKTGAEGNPLPPVPLLFVAAGKEAEITTPLPEGLPEMLTRALEDQVPSGPVMSGLWEVAHEFPHVDVVSATIEQTDGVVRSYPVARPLHKAGVYKSAAVRLYDIATCPPVDGLSSADLICGINATGDDIELFWNLTVPEENREWMACTEKTTAIALRWWAAIWKPASLKQPCPTIPTVPLIELMLPGRDADAKTLIEDRLVLYGADVIGGDSYATAVSDGVPGVFVHAMALQNLLAFDDRYLKRDLKIGPIRIAADNMTRFIGAPIVALIVSIQLAWWPIDRSNGTPLLSSVLAVILNDVLVGILVAILSLIASAILMGWISLMPLNWIYLGGVATTTIEGYRLWERFAPWLREQLTRATRWARVGPSR